MNGEVRVRREPVVFPTYEPAPADPNPMFLEKRVYQGSSGRVYPLPFIDRIAETPTDRAWDAVVIENDFVSLMMLPEIGGRIHVGQDKTNGYDFFYRQQVIKPALVGLAGPWASGGVEFNWPQHHRPSTFMPTDVFIEHGEDGSMTVWLSEHEPMNRMKGMHGVCLYPDRSVVELKVRLYNRTPYVQTFLWWTNIATHVHEAYRSFFPPDVHTVADHAKRATSRYPLCDDHYYGVDYGARGRVGVPQEEYPTHFLPPSCGGTGPDYAANDLSWYANIPVPTSYMCMGTQEDFVGGYDYFKQAGLLHVADHHIAPGKKQWTWGNHEFGYAWDRNLTDKDGPYIELMAGVYTDNQPDFSFIGPGETKTFSQFWYPYQAIGIAQSANVEAAIGIDGAKIGVATTRVRTNAKVAITKEGVELASWQTDIAPDKPFQASMAELDGPLVIIVESSDGKELARYETTTPEPSKVSPPATEPPMPAEVTTADELFVIGQHLDQYRHATRDAASYWQEALRRDPGDVRCNNAMGLYRFRRGEFAAARDHFQAAIDRATSRNPNPYDGEPYYNLGLALRFLGQDKEAFDALAKSVWNAAWQAPGYHALGELACKKGDWPLALDYLNRALRKDADNFRAADLKAAVLRKLGKDNEAEAVIKEVLQHDPLDFWARLLLGEEIVCDNGVRFDLAIDMLRAGLNQEALALLERANATATDGTAPLLHYYRAYIQALVGLDPRQELLTAQSAPKDYCFPARLEDLIVLEWAVGRSPEDPRAPYYLGNWFYDRRRHQEGIAMWERAARLEPSNSIALRNLGIGSFNILHDAEKAKACYEAAIAAAPDDARLRYEQDQLWKRIGVDPESRLAELRKRQDLVAQRDDLTIEFCHLLNAVGRPEEAEPILTSRRFQPWEGGEGQALGVYTRTQLNLGHRAMDEKDFALAKSHFEKALNPPENLSEARHLLANASDVWLALGDALHELGETEASERHWRRAANFQCDFQEMSVRLYSELTYFRAAALERLGQSEEARQLRDNLEAYAQNLANTQAKIDYFATSLPTMLLFEDDLQQRQENTARFLQAQVASGRGDRETARGQLDAVLRLDPNHAMATELLARLSVDNEFSAVTD